MFVFAVTAALVLSAPPTKLASPGWSFINVDGKKGDFFADYFAQQLGVRGIRVTTKSEISTLLGFERQKQLMGCASESTSCVAELAGALGVDGLIVGSLAKFKAGYTVNVKIVSAADGSQMAVASTTVRDDDALIEWLAAVAEKVAKALAAKAVVEPPKEPEKRVEPIKEAPKQDVVEPAPSEAVAVEQPADSGGSVNVAVVGTAVGAGLLAAGGTFALLQASSIDSELRKGPNGKYFDPDINVASSNARAAAERGQLFQVLGFAGIGTAVALGATAVYLGLTSDDDTVNVSGFVTGAGGGFVVQGLLP